MTPAPTTTHQRLLGKLYQVLNQHVLKYRMGEVFFAPVDVVLSERSVVQPDLIFISDSRRGRLTRKNVKGAPDLVVEVISEDSRKLDKKIKRDLYAASDALEYWLADPELRVLEVYRRDEEMRLVKVAELEDTGVVASPLFPGLAIELASLWQDPD